MGESFTAAVVGRWAYDRLFVTIAGRPLELDLAAELAEAGDVPPPGTTIHGELDAEGALVAWEQVKEGV